MPDNNRTYSLTELAQLGGVTRRTIRYYIGQGLLPSPIAEGPNTRYTAGHVDRLQLIRELQREHLPLAEIRSRVERLDDAQVRDLLAVGDAIPEPRGTAFDYIQSVLAGTNRRALSLPLRKVGRSSPSRPRNVPALPASPLQADWAPALEVRSFLRLDESSTTPEWNAAEADASEPNARESPAPEWTTSAPQEFLSTPPKPLSESLTLDRSQWDRISLAPDVELHIRRPLSRVQNRRVERLLSMARHILEEDQP